VGDRELADAVSPPGVSGESVSFVNGGVVEPCVSSRAGSTARREFLEMRLACAMGRKRRFETYGSVGIRV